MIALFFLFTLVLAISAVIQAGWAAGLSLLAVSLLSLIAGVRIHSAVRCEDWSKGEARNLAIVGIIISVAIVAVTQWLLASRFSVQFFGHQLSGETWGWISLAIGCVLPDQKILTGVGMPRKPPDLT